jgi:chitinase
VTIPSSTPAGDYSLTVCADSGATVFESNESNNCWTHDIVVPAPTVSIGDATVTEGNSGTTIMSFPVSLSVPSANPVTVDFTTVDGTAKAPGDYSVKSENLRFEAGQTNKTVEVLVNGDLRNERDETLGGMLSNSVGAAISDGTGVGTIVNDDPIPSVSISDVRLSEGDSGLKDFSFKVSLSARSGREVRVNWRTVNGSAYGSDYVPDSQLLKIPAGYLSKNVVVKVKGDVTVEINETFRVVLSAPVNATIADGSGRATIVNDD